MPPTTRPHTYDAPGLSWEARLLWARSTRGLRYLLDGSVETQRKADEHLVRMFVQPGEGTDQ